MRSRDTAAPVRWVVWALQAFPPVRANVASDAELAALLDHPLVKAVQP